MAQDSGSRQRPIGPVWLPVAMTEGVKVVTHYDGLRAQNYQSPLTAVNLHLDEITALAIEMLFEHLNGNTCRSVIRDPRPSRVVRASSARSPDG